MNCLHWKPTMIRKQHQTIEQQFSWYLKRSFHVPWNKNNRIVVHLRTEEPSHPHYSRFLPDDRHYGKENDGNAHNNGVHYGAASWYELLQCLFVRRKTEQLFKHPLRRNDGRKRFPKWYITSSRTCLSAFPFLSPLSVLPYYWLS